MDLNLYFVVLGATPPGRHTEQHDVFFGIGESVNDLVPQMEQFWPGVKLHIDSWRKVTVVDSYHVSIVPKEDAKEGEVQLFFLNLGGYKPQDMEEYHYKLLCVAANKAEAVYKAKKTAFYAHTGFKGATSHIDDKYGVDVDDIHQIKDILPHSQKIEYSLRLEKVDDTIIEDELQIGYVKFSSLKN
ncbi:MAG: DUF1543 domain-containing protein [Chitinophagaceae bacterium]|nr:MAG: DUF1543 domain-containing protein [Chitinophagaceae bacterium]